MIGRRHKYRKPRFRPFKASAMATAPGLMLLLGLVLSVGAHVALGVALYDQPIGSIDADAFTKERQPVRVKRARFDQIIQQGPRDGEGATPVESAEDLAEALMDEVETATSDPFEPEVELRSVPEPLPHLAMAAVATPGIDLDALLGEDLGAPQELTFDDSSRFDAPSAAATAAGSAQLAGDLLATLTAADGGLPGGGDVGGAPETIPGGDAATRAAGENFGPGSGRPGGVAPAPGTAPGTAGGTSGGSSGGGGVDFLGFGQLDPADFEPPERLDNDFDYAVSRFEAPGTDGHFRVRLTAKRSLRKLATMPKDVVFMVDTSRSIDQRTIIGIGQGIQQAIRTLNPGDRFNLVFFSDDVHIFADQPVTPDRDNVALADRWLRSAKARGFTDVNLALRQLLKRDLDDARVYELILISDGNPTLGVLDTRELINLITRENDLAASIYCVGIGRRQDNRLLEFLAYRNKGFAISVPRGGDVSGEIIALMSRLRYPIITDVQVRFAGVGMDEVYPLTLPNIHQGESFEVFGRFTEPGPFTVQITGRSAGKPVDMTFRADLQQAPQGFEDVAQGWAFWKLHHLYSEIIRVGERESLLKQINELHQRYQLQTLY